MFSRSRHLLGAMMTSAVLQLTVTRNEGRQEKPLSSFSPTPPLYYFQPNPDLEICYDTRTRTPVYVLERLRPLTRKKKAITGDQSSSASRRQRRRPHFVEETRLPLIFRNQNHHYKGSGYDRGHMAPAADFISEDDEDDTSGVCSSTFILTNVCPQDASLNRNIWNRLEQWVRKQVQYQARKDDDERNGKSGEGTTTTFVVTGPLWLPHSRLGDTLWEYKHGALGTPPSLVSVPTHFFKLIVMVHEETMTITKYAAFCIPNQANLDSSVPLEHYMVRWSDLEAVVGLQFFSQLIHAQDGDDWRALADRATELVWNRSKQPLLLTADGGGSGRSKKMKATLRGKKAPVHLCQGGACK